MLDMAIAVAAAGESLGVRCARGDVLYLALEDNLRRLRSRLDCLMPTRDNLPSGLLFAVEWPRASAGGLKRIEEWLGEHPSARLVVIDVLAAFRDPRNGNQQLYDGDYSALKSLQEIAMRAAVAIVVVHHTRKSGSEAGDPFEKVSGTLGLSGAADSVIVLDRDGVGCTLYGRGRDIPEFEVASEFDRKACRWRALGRADEVRRTDERKTILDELKQADEPLSPNEIAGATGMRQTNVRKLLSKMCKAGEVLKRGRGRYIHPDWTDLEARDVTDDVSAADATGHDREKPNINVTAENSTPGHVGHKVTKGTKASKIHVDVEDADVTGRCAAGHNAGEPGSDVTFRARDCDPVTDVTGGRSGIGHDDAQAAWRGRL